MLRDGLTNTRQVSQQRHPEENPKQVKTQIKLSEAPRHLELAISISARFSTSSPIRNIHFLPRVLVPYLLLLVLAIARPRAAAVDVNWGFAPLVIDAAGAFAETRVHVTPSPRTRCCYPPPRARRASIHDDLGSPSRCAAAVGAQTGFTASHTPRRRRSRTLLSSPFSRVLTRPRTSSSPTPSPAYTRIPSSLTLSRALAAHAPPRRRPFPCTV
jgi:hypothetical protein